MPRAFAEIAFTPSVKAAQTRYGSREGNLGFELADDPRNTLQAQDAAFIEARDSFYQATVAENGWPYVQHRGGPAGFLRVLDERRIGYADFRGNAQYLSVGNLNADPRIALILMDYANRRRMKLWGRARIVHEADDPALVARLEIPSYRAKVERGVVITIEAIEWNCPQHITARYTEAEVEKLVAPLVEENRQLRATAVPASPPAALGGGPLALVISGARQLTPRIRAFELRHLAGEPLPAITAGAHLRVPVRLADGQAATRHYSISSNPARRDAWEIAVLLHEDGSGGSRFIHQAYALGSILCCDPPRNDFGLRPGPDPAVLIAGGIGITPIKAMALALRDAGCPFEIHYAGRSRRDMAYLDRLERQFGTRLQAYPGDMRRLQLGAVMAGAAAHARFYVCGPQRLLDDAIEQAATLGIPLDRLHFERFAPPAVAEAAPAQAVEVELRRSGKTLHVAAGQSILDALEQAGVRVHSDCRVGNCGSCAVTVLDGTPLHVDSALTERERTQGRRMCICVSRARSPRLVLDL
jgi:hypothetical protein